MKRRLPKPIRKIILLVFLWDLTIKSLAVWRAARRREIGWFIALMFTNTAGILPLKYLRRPKPVPRNQSDR